jgi:riboflavin synthase
MFTGLVEELGTVEQATSAGSRRNPALKLTIKSPLVAKDARVGDSIAVNGCCLTVVKKVRNLLTFEAGSETLSRTNLGRLKAGGGVNLERSLKVGDRLGGHLVMGHIDAAGTVLKRSDAGEWSTIVFRVPPRLTRQMVGKGSVAVDGVSLTLVTVGPDWFSVALIPHTLEATTLGRIGVGDAVNIETDLLAKYVERQVQSRGAQQTALPQFA